MKLLIDERPFSWDAHYDIYDESGDFTYRVVAEKDKKGGSITVTSRFGVEVGQIKKTRTLLKDKYEIFLSDELMGTVQKEFMYGITRYVLNYKQWRVFGNILGWEYDILDEKFMVAHAGNEDGAHPGKYVLDTSYSNNEIPTLLVALAMEAANADMQSKKTDFSE